MNQRNGTDVDAANVMKVFAKLGYRAKVYNDQTVDQMRQVLTSGKFDVEFIQNFSQEMLSFMASYSCLYISFFQLQRKITAATPRSSVFC